MACTISGDTGVSAVQSGAVEQGDLAANVVGNGPCFSAYQSVAHSVTGSMSKIRFQSEEVDTANAFDSAINYRFQPQVAGYYHVIGRFQVSNSYTTISIQIWKNGSSFKQGSDITTNAAAGTISALVYLNGSSDYVELYGLSTTTQDTLIGPANTYFQGFLARAAS